jgi:hypothetical protein
MRHLLHLRGVLPILVTLLLVLFALGSCDARTTSREARVTPVALFNPTEDSTTHHSSPTPSPTVTPITNVVPANTAGWPIYSDRMFPFQMPVPTNWREGSFVDDRSGHTQCEEVIGLLPPGSTGAIIDGFENKAPEYIALFVKMNCPPYDPTQNPNDPPLPSSIVIGGVTVPWFGTDDPTYGMSRDAEANFGGRQYEFLLQAPPSSVRDDIALFLGVMKGFRYLG